MNDWLAMFSNSKDAALLAVAACAVLVIGGREVYCLLFGSVEQGAKPSRTETIIEIVAGVFVVMLVAGKRVLGAQGHVPPNLPFVLLALAAVVIVTGLRWYLRRNRPLADEEMRRTAAHDL